MGSAAQNAAHLTEGRSVLGGFERLRVIDARLTSHPLERGFADEAPLDVTGDSFEPGDGLFVVGCGHVHNDLNVCAEPGKCGSVHASTVQHVVSNCQGAPFVMQRLERP